MDEIFVFPVVIFVMSAPTKPHSDNGLVIIEPAFMYTNDDAFRCYCRHCYETNSHRSKERDSEVFINLLAFKTVG